MIINHDYSSPNFNERPDGCSPDMVILHYTGMESGEEALKRLCDPSAEVSAHYLIEEDGRVFELVPPKKRAWHAGVSHWQGRDNLNHYSIGIEIVNPGHEFGYRDFPEIQISSVLDLIKHLDATFDIPSHNYIGHSDIAPTRKMDPGEKFPWCLFADEGFGAWSDLDGGDLSPVHLETDKHETAILQQGLKAIGYEVEVTGDYDDMTRSCVTAFQRHWRPASVTGDYDVGTKTILCATLSAIKEK
jgi:N-acetylmuramoyl-L-alanine amidase